MLSLAYRLLRPLLFALDAERAHEAMLATLARAPRAWAALARLGGLRPPSTPWNLGPLALAGPVGLAAGLDKDGAAVPFWPSLGFGFVEVGTVTAHPQPGNPRPRLFRLPSEAALINRMGFNNRGSAALAARLRALREAGRWPTVPVGVNVGKSKVTPVEAAADDYVLSLERLAGLADYFTVNISSPNTPGLRSLQDSAALSRLLPAVMTAAGATPVLLKIAPDLGDEAVAEVVELAVAHGLAGLIATNTTIRRDVLARDPGLEGGLSGRPLAPLARQTIATALAVARGRLPVVGVGGLETAAQVRDLLRLGCSAVQVYTALIYRGPGLPARLGRELAAGEGAER